MWNAKFRMNVDSNLLSTFMREAANSNGVGIKRLRTSKSCRNLKGQLIIFLIVSV
jgi:hypothetical protein